MDDYGDTLTDAEQPGNVRVGSTIVGEIETDGDVDLIAVMLTAGQLYTFTMRPDAANPSFGCDLEIRAADGVTRLKDAIFNSPNATLEFRAPESGKFYLAATAYAKAAYLGSTTGRYSIATQTGVNDDFGDTIIDDTPPPGVITVGTSRGGILENDDDTDVFSVQLVEDHRYVFDYQGGQNNRISVLDAAGNSIESATVSGSGAGQVSYVAKATGTFFFKVERSTSGTIGSYTINATDAGVVPDDFGDTPTDTSPVVGVLQPGTPRMGALQSRQDVDVFKVVLQGGQTYTFDLNGSLDGGGTLPQAYLSLEDAQGRTVGSGSDIAFFPNRDCQIVFTAPTGGGTYYLYASGGGATGTYTISALTGAPDDFGDTIADTAPPPGTVTVGAAAVAGKIEAAGDKDVFAVGLVAGKTYTFDLLQSLQGGQITDSQLRLLSAGGAELAKNDLANSANAEITFTARRTETFYLEASGPNGAVGNYQVVAKENVDDFRDVFNDASEPLGAATAAGTKGMIEVAGDQDVFRVRLTAGQTYTFDARSDTSSGTPLADPNLRLLDPNGKPIALNQDFNGPNARIVFTAATAGSYYLDVRGSATGAYIVSAKAGFDDYRDVYNVGPEALGRVTVNATTTQGTIETAGDADVFAVRLAAGQTYTFDAVGSNLAGAALADPELRLRDASGAEIRFNDDFNGPNARIAFTAATAGIYYLDVRGGGTGGYTVAAKAAFDDFRDVYNLGPKPLGQLDVDGTSLGTIETAGDADVFRVKLALGQTYTFGVTGTDVAGDLLDNPAMELRGPGGALIASNLDFDGGPNARLSYAAATAGDYYVVVKGENGTTGTYEVSATVAPPDDWRDVFNDASEPLGRLTVNGPMGSGVIEVGGDKDVFAFTLLAGQTYVFDLKGEGAGGTLHDPFLQLLDDGGVEKARNDDVETGVLDSQITFRTTKFGTYYLSATGFDGSTGSYKIGVRAPDDWRDQISDPSSPIGRVAVNRTKAGVIETAGDQDMFSFNGVADKHYVVEVVGATNGLDDPEMRVLTAQGTIIGYNDDISAANPDSRLTVNMGSADESIFIQVSGVKGDVGAFTVRVTEASPSFDMLM